MRKKTDEDVILIDDGDAILLLILKSRKLNSQIITFETSTSWCQNVWLITYIYADRQTDRQTDHMYIRTTHGKNNLHKRSAELPTA